MKIRVKNLEKIQKKEKIEGIWGESRQAPEKKDWIMVKIKYKKEL